MSRKSSRVTRAAGEPAVERAVATPGAGRPLADLAAELGLAAADVARLRDLEQENVRLRRIVADRDLEIEMLREISRGTY